MSITEYQLNLTAQFCFPDNNASCKKEDRASPENIFLCFFLSCVSVCTVFLNLLVIISISHFKQLHTPTNLLILSLAVADLLVGLVVMPFNIMLTIDNCWYLGKIGCNIFPVINYLSMSASLGSLVFIAADRYIAINDPLLYCTKITVCKTSLCIVISWSCSILYNTLFFYFDGHLLDSYAFINCFGECILATPIAASVVDLFVSFIGPCFIILFLYVKIFQVARDQAKTVNSESDKAHGHGIKSSKHKAAKKLGIVVFVYLACWIPYYLSSVSITSMTSLSLVFTVFNWLLSINSSVNPLIYAIFYPWFRASTKYILTCRIFEISSSMFNLFSDRS